MVKHGITPDCWNTSHIYPIPKASDSITIDKFRPIALTPMLRRIFENIFLQYLNSLELSHFDPLQAGFRSGFSTMTHSVISHDLFYLKNDDQRLDRIFIDLKQAYDRVDIDILLNKLKKRSDSDLITNVIYSLFTNCYSTVSINGSISQPFKRQRGLFQGSILSPFLFNIYIDDLITSLSNNEKIPSALLFADDIQLMPKNYDEAKKLLKIVEEWCIYNRMQINVQKSGYIGPSDWRLTIDGLELPKPSSYKYLGLPVIKGGIDWKSFVLDSTKRSNGVLKFMQVKGNNWPPITRLMLYRSNIRSLWEYAAPLMSIALKDTEFDLIEAVQERSLAWVLGSSDHSGHQYRRLFRSLSGIESIVDRFETLQIKFGIHVANSSASNPLYELISQIEINNSMASNESLIKNNIHNHSEFRIIKPNIKKNGYIRNYLCKRKVGLLSITRSDSDRIKYLNKSSRHRRSAADVSLYVKDKFLSRLAIKWRMSTIFFKKTCVKCKNPFRISHLNDCFNVTGTDELFNFRDISELENRLKYIQSMYKL
ncbi:putative RNA-directed DNA polymerase from transposon BS [Smittium culicis]|uniref:Putative RNA-directed DNA polymerase from transposon BS n=1 Tax=Smittium culicis TaxID=133412 RepID=A0A1R1Y2S6_9FUNG|nr:putative RNA-directed DNA polymerase from transposon BS [Smittium culicis]